MKDSQLRKLLEQAVKSSGSARVAAALSELARKNVPDKGVLTIIANAGVHTIPKPFLRGEVYEASRGDWDVSSEQALVTELGNIMLRLISKLRARQWERIYLVPTGHPILSLQIKAMVYRVLRLNTIDLYHKAGTYFEVNLDHRAIALTEGHP